MLPDDFKEFLRFLSEAEVAYLPIGGYAVSYHGYPAQQLTWIYGLPYPLAIPNGPPARARHGESVSLTQTEPVANKTLTARA